MSISANNLSGITWRDQIETERAKTSTVNNQNNFSDLLHDSLQQTSASISSGAALPPLTREQLNFLVKVLQAQMNRQLYNIVFSGGMEINYFPSRMLPVCSKEIVPSSIETSKKCQVPPKKDSNKTDSNLDNSNLSNSTLDNSNLDSIINKAAGKYGVDSDLIRSVIKTESNFNSRATSPKGAMGLMQLMPGTARDLGVKNAYDPEENIMGGTRYLKTLLNRYDGKVDLALAAYNWGMGNLEKNPERLPRETSNYITRVNSHYKNFRAST
ncbi:MAG: lytic transglycosylase domain-containing protein [Smithella sp.]